MFLLKKNLFLGRQSFHASKNQISSYLPQFNYLTKSLPSQFNFFKKPTFRTFGSPQQIYSFSNVDNKNTNIEKDFDFKFETDQDKIKDPIESLPQFNTIVENKSIDNSIGQDNSESLIQINQIGQAIAQISMLELLCYGSFVTMGLIVAFEKQLSWPEGRAYSSFLVMLLCIPIFFISGFIIIIKKLFFE